MFRKKVALYRIGFEFIRVCLRKFRATLLKLRVISQILRVSSQKFRENRLKSIIRDETSKHQIGIFLRMLKIIVIIL